MSDYNVTILPIQELAKQDLESITDLYLRHYDGCNRETMQIDLASKSEILLVFHAKRIVGFTAFEFYTRNWNGKKINIVFSGDTVVEIKHWGQQALAFNWLMRMGQFKSLQPDVPLYWFLIVKGHRTFRYLDVFSRSYFPHWSEYRPMLKKLAEYLAIDKFPRFFNPHSGVIEFPEYKGYLTSSLAFPREKDLSSQAVRFFLQSNPGYRQGHELVCLCELSVDNLKPMARRLFARSVDFRSVI